MGFSWKHNEDLIAGLVRKQIDGLNTILRDLEFGKPFTNSAHENLKNIEQQIRWLRTVGLHK